MDVIDPFLLQRPVKLCLFLKWILAGCRCDLHHLRLNLNKTPWHFHDISDSILVDLAWRKAFKMCQGGSWWSTSAEFPLQAGFGGWIDSGGCPIFYNGRCVSNVTAIFSRPALAFEATEPECLIPIMLGCPEIAMIGHVYFSRTDLMKWCLPSEVQAL